MEIQRNKTLNRLFIVLAVLTIVLRSASMILEIWLDGSIHLGLLCSLLCAVLPILAMACSRHKAASIVFSVAYIIVLAFALWVTQIANGRLASLTSWNMVSNCANILLDCTYGIFPLLNAVGKVENKKKLAITCLILGGHRNHLERLLSHRRAFILLLASFSFQCELSRILLCVQYDVLSELLRNPLCHRHGNSARCTTRNVQEKTSSGGRPYDVIEKQADRPVLLYLHRCAGR